MKRFFPVFFLMFFIEITAYAENLDPLIIYSKVRPSLHFVTEFGKDDKPIRASTGIDIDKHKTVILCDAYTSSRKLKINVADKQLNASFIARDTLHNLCVLSVPGADLQAVDIATLPLEVNERVYTIANIQGFNIGIAQGIYKGERHQINTDFLEFTAPIAQGSDGGALVNAKGQLQGLIALALRDGKGFNTAVPVKWALQIEQNAKNDDAFSLFRNTVEQLLLTEQSQKLTEYIQQWLSLHPDDAYAWRLSLAMAMINHHSDQEELAWRKLHELEPTLLATTAGFSNALIKKGKITEALELDYAFLSLRQDDASAWLLVGQAEQAANNPDKAEIAFQKSVTISPWQSNNYLELVAVAEKQNNYHKISGLLQTLNNLSLGSAANNLQMRLASAYTQDKHPELAYPILKRMTVPKEQKSTLDFALGMTYQGLGRPSDAIQYFQESLKENPAVKTDIYSALGKAYDALGEHQNSINTYRQLVSLEPNNDFWQFELARVLRDGGHLDESLQINNQLLKKQTDVYGLWVQTALYIMPCCIRSRA